MLRSVIFQAGLSTEPWSRYSKNMGGCAHRRKTLTPAMLLVIVLRCRCSYRAGTSGFHELQRHPVRSADALRFGMLPVWPSEIRHRVVDVEGFGVLGVGVDFVDAVDADAGFQDQRDQLVLAQRCNAFKLCTASAKGQAWCSVRPNQRRPAAPVRAARTAPSWCVRRAPGRLSACPRTWPMGRVSDRSDYRARPEMAPGFRCTSRRRAPVLQIQVRGPVRTALTQAPSFPRKRTVARNILDAHPAHATIGRWRSHSHLRAPTTAKTPHPVIPAQAGIAWASRVGEGIRSRDEGAVIRCAVEGR